MRRVLICLSALCLLASASFAASPALGNIQPRGAQRGTDVVLQFSGSSLADTQELIAYTPGIAVKSLAVVNPTTVNVTVTIAPDCRLGEHVFRLRTATGISDARTFWVGAMPTFEEKEPNSEFDKPQIIAINSTIHGSIGGEDVDYFEVECKAGQRLSVEVEGMRLANGFWDPFVAIMDSKRFEMVTSDDTPLLGQDCGCSVKIPADGKYIVQIRESAFGGGIQYRLHIGNFPRPTAVVPAGGKPGEELEVRFIGDPLGEIKQKVKLPAAADLNYRLHCQTPEGITPTGFKFRVVDLPNAVGTGANISLPTAVPGTAPGAFNGVVNPGQSTYFRFPAKKGQVFDVHCYARRIGSPLDPVMYLGGHTVGGEFVSNDDSAGPDSYFRFTAPEDKEYAVRVHDHLQKGGPDYFFRIEVTPVAAKTTTNIPKVNGNNVSDQTRQTIVVPKGNRYATVVTVNRADWGGNAALGFDKLPAGMTFAADPIDAGQSQVPVVFEAKPDAPTAGFLAEMLAKPADPMVVALAKTDIDINYSIGLNNTPFHRIFSDKVAVAVADVAPFSIEVMEPKAPVVQNGSMVLKIVAKRAPGFTGPITVSPVWTPPGMGIQGANTIPDNALETTLQMNAAPNAAPKKWKTAVLATANTPTGVVYVSSQLFTLEVAPPFVTFAMERSAVEQGKDTEMLCKITVASPFVGEAPVKLIGLPTKATTTDLKLTKDTKELAFKVLTDKTTPAGKHGVFCQVIVPVNGEQVIHSVGGAEFRVDVPLPPKPAAVAVATPVTPATPVPAQPAAAPPKRLSRLEQLRLEQEEREKAAKAGTPAVPVVAPKK